MTTEKTALNDVATALKVHPRTVLRAYTGDRNAYWSDNKEYNPEVVIDTVAKAFNCAPSLLRRVLAGNDDFLTTEEAAAALDLKVRTFRWRDYQRAVRKGSIVRYSRAKLVHENFKKWD